MFNVLFTKKTEMKSKGIKNLLIDLGGVLINLDRQRCIEHFQKLGLQNVDDLLDIQNQDGILMQQEKGLITPAEFRDGVRKMIGKAVSDKQIDAAWNSFLPKSKGGCSMPQNRRSYEKTRRIALSGLLFALAMALSFIEGTLTIPGLLPGMKLGLANIVVMYALFFMGPKQALVLDVLKALFVFLVSGFTAGLLSLCGGLLSLLVMWVLYYLLPVRPTWFILSVCGALAHNIGQLLGAGVIISSSLSFYYAPVMLVLGLVMGALTSITLKALLPALGKMGFSTQEKRKED